MLLGVYAGLNAFKNVFEGLNARKGIFRLKCSKMCMKAQMLENIYEGLNVRSEVYLSKEYFCKICQTCVSPRLCEFIQVLEASFSCMTVADVIDWLCKFCFLSYPHKTLIFKA